MEERETTEVETPSESYESPSIGEMLSGEAPEATAIEPESQATPEVVEPVAQGEVTPETPAPAQEAAPAQTQTPVTPAPPITPEIQALIDARVAESTKGLIGAVQAERMRRQELQAQLGGAVPMEQAQSEVAQLKNQFLEMSEIMARQAFPDYDQVVQNFYQEAASNEALRESVLNAKAPAMAAYQAGLNVKLSRELGPDVVGNPYVLMQKTKEKYREELRQELAREFEGKLSAKSQEKQKTPTDISQARAAGGGSQPYVSPSLSDMLKMANKR